MKFHSIEHAKAIALEVEAIRRSRWKPAFGTKKFEKQYNFINDNSSLIAVQCPRRSGKSEGLGRKQLKECFDHPGTAQLYIGLTFASARAIAWDAIFKKLNEDLQLQGDPNESRLEMRFPNGSKIVLFGADSNEREIDKKLGGKYRSIVIDEAAFFKQDLNNMVYEKLLPCVADYDGWVALASTTSEYTNGLFYDVTNYKETGWSVHKWTGDDNPFMKEKLRKQIALLKKTKPRIEETPAFRRMYLNEWVIDTDSLCYKYNRDINDIDKIPHDDPMYHVIGIDLGFNDATAFSVLCFGDYDPDCYVKFAYKQSRMIISDVAKRIQFLMNKYDPIAIVVDNASKQAVEELKQKFELPLIAAEKQGKADFIEIMNSDFITGNIKLLPGAQPLKVEYGSLIWDKQLLPKKIEHPGCENHLCFVAGTKIRTPSGLVEIQKLNVGDFVETRKGPRKIQFTIARDAEVVQVNLSNGRRIVCTPDHPFYSDDKWIQAKDLKQTSELLSWNQHLRLRESNLMGIHTENTRKKNISKGRTQKQKSNVCTYIERFGLRSVGQYLTGTISTIKTGIRQTIGLQTLSVYQRKTISTSIKRLGSNGQRVQKTINFLKRIVIWRQPGIGLKKVENGIENTGKRLLVLLKLYAHGVMQNIKSLICQKINKDVALTNVFQQNAETAELMTLQRNVNGAEKNTQSINIQGKETVQGHVLGPILNIGKRTVYNITVEDAHEYFAEDILVSNCDATLYGFRFCYQYRSERRPEKKNEEDLIDEWFDDEAERLEKEDSLEYWEEL